MVASPSIPKVFFSLVMMCAISALRSSALEGMQPTLRQTPPQYFSSTTATVCPSCAARIAATYPPGPAAGGRADAPPGAATEEEAVEVRGPARQPTDVPAPGLNRSGAPSTTLQ